MVMSQMVSDTISIIVNDSLSLMCGNYQFVCIKTSFCYKKHLITLGMSLKLNKSKVILNDII